MLCCHEHPIRDMGGRLMWSYTVKRQEGNGTNCKKINSSRASGLSFKSLLLKSQSTFCSPKSQPFFRMGFSEQEFQIPTKILQRFSKDCIFSFDYHVFHSYRLLTASCFSLASLLCPRQSIAATKGGFIFDRPCTGSCNCVLQNVTCLCVCSPGHSFWWDRGSGGAGAWDGDSAHCECCCAGSGHPWNIPLLQHVSLVQGRLMCLQVKIPQSCTFLLIK